MEYVYASMLLHSAKQEINEASITKVLEAAGIKADSAKVKVLIASLKEVNIDEAIEKAAMPAAAPAALAAEGREKKEEKPVEEEGKTEEEAAEGLGALFG